MIGQEKKPTVLAGVIFKAFRTLPNYLEIVNREDMKRYYCSNWLGVDYFVQSKSAWSQKSLSRLWEMGIECDWTLSMFL